MTYKLRARTTFLLAASAAILTAISAAQTSTWRPVVMGRDHLVASGHYATAMAGQRILEQGGNALDAGIAATFASTVVEPSRAGIGGHLMINYYDAETGKVTCINGSGWSGKAATPDRFQDVNLPPDGAVAALVPGAVEAMLRASSMFGRVPRERLLAPAIELAEDGFVVSENLHNVLRRNQAALEKFPSTTKFWFRGEEPVRMGDRIVQKDLAHTFRLIAQGGRDAFYRGPIAKRIIAFLAERGGILDASDFAEYKAEVTEPLRADYRGYTVYDSAQSSFDHVTLESLKILEGFDLKSMGHNSPEYIHHLAEAMKLAFADRDATVGNKRFPEGMPHILTDKFAAKRRKLIRKRRALDLAPPGKYAALLPQPTLSQPTYARHAGTVRQSRGAEAHPPWIDGLTTYVAVIDKDRNMVSITSSVSSDFGNKMYIDGTGGGFFVNNWLQLFRTDPEHANVIAPRKVPRTGWSPMLVLKQGKPFMVFGTPGGDRIPQLQLQFFLNFVDFGMNVQQALEQAAVTTTGFQAYRHPNAVGKNLVVSDRIPEDTRRQLANWGHHITTHDALGIGGVKAVWWDAESDVLRGGAAPATDGYVVGW